jgi:iron-sulfur cluster assembly accessory protein
MVMIPITLTDAAKTRIAELTARKEGALGVKLWIAEGKGCGGNEYRMDHVMAEDPLLDKISVAEDVALFIPMMDSFKLFGMTIDFSEDELGNAAFSYTNPNEAARCGCGESFSFDLDALAKNKASV